MPAWGKVLSTEQLSDTLALLDAWRAGQTVEPIFSVTDLLESAVFSLENKDAASAALHVKRAIKLTKGPAFEMLNQAARQLSSGNNAGALDNLQTLKKQWPMGDAKLGAQTYATQCAPCHGAQGEGGIGKKLQPNQFIQDNTNAKLVEFVLAGRAGTAMAGFDGRLSEEEIANVLAFLRTWQ